MLRVTACLGNAPVHFPPPPLVKVAVHRGTCSVGGTQEESKPTARRDSADYNSRDALRVAYERVPHGAGGAGWYPLLLLLLPACVLWQLSPGSKPMLSSPLSPAGTLDMDLFGDLRRMNKRQVGDCQGPL